MSDIHRKIEAVWKIESTRLIAGIARVTHDIAIAEDLAQDALVAAIEQWPEEGIPDKPAAWLMTAAKRRAIDFLRVGGCWSKSAERLRGSFKTGSSGWPKQWIRHWTRSSMMTSCASSLPLAIQSSQLRTHRIDVASDLRPHHSRDCPCLLGAGEDTGAADLSRYEHSL